MANLKTPNPEQGSRFNRWTILSKTPHKSGNIHFLCRCDCGTEKPVYKSSLISGRSISCGCHMRELIKERHKNSHKKVGTKIYWVWADMVGRCTNPKHKWFRNYGGRGITVDQSWRYFPNFYRDMGEPLEGYSLDRKNNDLGYNKSNCRWATKEEQANNKRSTVKHKVGEDTLTLREISNKYGISMGVLRRQVYVKKRPVNDLVLEIYHNRNSSEKT